MSTFAEAHLREMTPAQMAQYDLFLDENDWDIYYWATQEPSPTSMETAEGAGPQKASPVAQGTDPGKQAGPELETDEWKPSKPGKGGHRLLELSSRRIVLYQHDGGIVRF